MGTQNDNTKSANSKHTIDDLRQMQSVPLEVKIEMTKNRIRAWLDVYDSYVSFSGGKDSTVLLHIARQVDPDIKAVFIDTGLEYPEIREFVKTIPNVVWLKPEMNFRKVIETYGYPLISKEVAFNIYQSRLHPDGCTKKKFDDNSEYNIKYKRRYSMARWRWLRDSDIPISAKCCDIMKKKPAKQFEKESGLKPILATMASESAVRTSVWLKNGCNAFGGRRPVSQPMSFWTDQDVLQYIKEYDVAYVSVYGDIIVGANDMLTTTGCNRTGCVFCGFGCHLEKAPNRFQKLKTTHPKLWDYCMRPLDRGGLGMKDVLQSINVPTE